MNQLSLADGKELLQSSKYSLAPAAFHYSYLVPSSSGYATSSYFKTASSSTSGGLQAVLLGTPLVGLFSIYMDIVRPAIAPKDEDPATARLFLAVKNGKGEPGNNLGLHVIRFARAKLGLSLAPTSIRAIVDTSVVAEHRRGNISDEQLAATYKVSGHTADTSVKFYQRYWIIKILLLLFYYYLLILSPLL